MFYKLNGIKENNKIVLYILSSFHEKNILIIKVRIILTLLFIELYKHLIVT